MNIKRIVRYLELKSQLTAEELQMAETMVGLTESDKEALAGLLQPVKAKAKPTATKRVIERCDTCGATRRHLVHKDTNSSEYHEFQPSQSSSKSKRASSLASVINKKITDKEPRCVVCFETQYHFNHDLANGGHEFTTDLAGRVNETLDGHNEDACTHNYPGEGVCGKPADENVHHLSSAPGYHEFVGSETAVGVGGG